MKKIYLDFNIILSLVNEEEGYKDLFAKIHCLKKKGYIFPYSPAHIEEIAVNKGKYDVNKRLEIISFISDNWEYFPTMSPKAKKHLSDELRKALLMPQLSSEHDTCRKIIEQLNCSIDIGENNYQTKLKKEDPLVCYERVIKDEDNNTLAEINEKYHVGRRDKKTLGKNFSEIGFNSEGIEVDVDYRKKNNIEITKLNNLDEKNLFSDKLIELLKIFFQEKGCILKKGNDLLSEHSELEEQIDLFLKFLEKIGYHQEKDNNSKLRSRMHDTTHAIYGANADVFVTNDIKFMKKLKAAYYFLNIPCKVIDKRELLTNL